MSLGNDLDQERRTETADMAGVILRLKMELVNAHALRRRDLDLVVVVPAAVGFAHHDALGRDDLDDGVEMVRAHQSRPRERRLDVLASAWMPLFFLILGSCGGGMGRPMARAVCEHERIVVGAQDTPAGRWPCRPAR